MWYTFLPKPRIGSTWFYGSVVYVRHARDVGFQYLIRYLDTIAMEERATGRGISVVFVDLATEHNNVQICRLLLSRDSQILTL